MKTNSPKHERKFLALLCGAGMALLGQSVATAADFLGATTTIAPYLSSSTFNFTSIRSVADATNFSLPQMVGIPDGLGAFDNGNGTFTALMSHELSTGTGINRAHGTNGALVSRWVIDKNTFAVQSITDHIQQISLWDTGTSSFLPASTAAGPAYAFNRFCSSDLAPQSAFQFGGLGTANRIFLNGEEAGTDGRAFGHIITGPSAGTTYQLPHLGKFSWENAVASPFAQTKTIVIGMDDNATEGQVYMYVGNKQAVGNDVEKAGLVGGNLFGVQVTGFNQETNGGAGVNGTFTMFNKGNVANLTGTQVNANSTNNGVMNFNRPEDGAWDPSNPNDFYFVTTASATGSSRLYRMRFADINNPENGGTISAVLDGSEGQVMFDNISVGADGKIMLQEDPGGNNRFSKIYEYDIATDTLVEAAAFKSSLFAPTGGAIFNNDEEASGIIDVSDILGYKAYLLDAQVHTASALPGAVQEGQLLLMTPVPEPSTYALLGIGVLGLIAKRFRRKS